MTLSKVGKVGTLVGFIAAATCVQSTAQSVVGKTCRGTFQLRGTAPDKRLGAFQITFGGTAEKPTAHVWRAFGMTVWQKVDREVNSGVLSADLSGFQDLGEAEHLVIEDSQVTFSTRQGANIALTYDSQSAGVYDGTGIISTPSPGEPAGRLEWRGASSHVLCR